MATTFNRIFGTDIDTSIGDAATAIDMIDKITALEGSAIAAERGQMAGSIIEGLQKSLPSMYTEPEAARKVMAKLMIDIQRPIDQIAYYNKWSVENSNMLTGAETGFSNDMISVYDHDYVLLQRAMMPMQVKDSDGILHTMTAIEALNEKILTPAHFDQMFPGVIRYYSVG